jgi:hypothetical protein
MIYVPGVDGEKFGFIHPVVPSLGELDEYSEGVKAVSDSGRVRAVRGVLGGRVGPGGSG